MPDNNDIEKTQADLLSTAIDALNRGETQAEGQENELQELLAAAKLVKNAALQPAPSQPVLEDIVNHTVNTIVRKQKKRFAWGLTGLAGAVAAILLFVFSQTMMPVSPRKELAKMPQPAPAVELPSSPAGDKTPADVAKNDSLASGAVQQASPREAAPVRQVPAAVQQPAIAPALPLPPVSADSGDTMLALAGYKADIITIDSVSKVIRQVYNQGTPDEIIITQGPKRHDTLRTAPSSPQTGVKRAMTFANESDLTLPDRNRITANVGNRVVTIEGAQTEEELLKLVQKLTEVSMTDQSNTPPVP